MATGSPNENVKWRILGVENGKVQIISDSIGTLTLLGKDGGYYTLEDEKTVEGKSTEFGYNNAINQLDAMASVYAGGAKAISARSVRASDINKVTGYNPYKTGTGEVFDKGDSREYGNTVTYSYKDGSNAGIYYKGENGAEGIKVNTKLDPDDNYKWFDSIDGVNISSSNPSNTLSYTSSYYYYSIETLTSTRHPSKPSIGLVTDTAPFNMICADKSYHLAKYWLADQDICANPSRTSWQIRYVWGETVNAATLYHSYDPDDEEAKTASVRVVVTLDESAKLVYDEANSIWNIE